MEELMKNVNASIRPFKQLLNGDRQIIEALRVKSNQVIISNQIQLLWKEYNELRVKLADAYA